MRHCFSYLTAVALVTANFASHTSTYIWAPYPTSADMPQIESCWNYEAYLAKFFPAFSTTRSDGPLPSAEHLSHEWTLLLKCNEIPLDHDIPLIRDFICRGQKQLDTLDAAIDHLRETLTQLTLSREVIAESLHQHRGVVSPVRRLPLELLWEIFALTLPDESGSIEPHLESTIPWRVSAVCRSWREAALSYGPLWSTVTVPFSRTQFAALKLETQLKRSRNGPLDISFQQRAVTSQVFNMVFAQCHRWDRLHLEVSPSTAPNLQALRNSADGSSLPSLQRLEVIVSSSSPAVAVPDVFSTARQLRKVMLTDASFRFPSPRLTISWDGITHYRANYPRWQHLEILKAAPNLRECNIHHTEFQSSIGLDWETVTLPHLRRLHVDCCNFLLHLNAPLLENLVLSEAGRVQNLLPFARGAPGLQRLTLLHCSINEGSIQLLRSLPVLMHLFIKPDFCPSNSDYISFLEAMTMRESAPSLCPALTCIIYGISLDFPCPIDSLFTMARSRFNAPQNLKMLRIFVDNPRALPLPRGYQEGTQMLRDGRFDADLLRHDDPWILDAKSDFL
ncbi:hypothetical protein C8R47DRAFT_1154166 [Mycena vitilis]|nr:hypothetical protein C8R47DRAFT_1154166 [Mycena vitilis]